MENQFTTPSCTLFACMHQVSARKAVTPSVSRRAVVVCKAQKSEENKASLVAAAALAVVVGLSNVEAAKADIVGLTPCSESKAYAKRLKGEVKGLTKRLAKVWGPS